MKEQQERTLRLLGEPAVKRLQKAKVLVVGLGGVGGAALENLVRLGIGSLILVDGDRISASNCNRQLIALSSNVGRSKAEAWADRCRDISPEAEIVAIPQFLRTPEERQTLLAPKPDCVVDAIDEVPAKIALLAECVKRNIPVVSSMGAGGKLDPAGIRIADIKKTFGCPLAKAVRKGLRDEGIDSGVTTVFSPEPARREMPGPIGSISPIPNAFGCFAATAVLNVLCPELKNLQK